MCSYFDCVFSQGGRGGVCLFFRKLLAPKAPDNSFWAPKGENGVVWCGVVWCGVVWCGVEEEEEEERLPWSHVR